MKRELIIKKRSLRENRRSFNNYMLERELRNSVSPDEFRAKLVESVVKQYENVINLGYIWCSTFGFQAYACEKRYIVGIFHNLQKLCHSLRYCSVKAIDKGITRNGVNIIFQKFHLFFHCKSRILYLYSVKTINNDI